MTSYFLLKYFHVVGAVIILGTGMGIAFFMRWLTAAKTLLSLRKRPVVVVADTLFTASAVFVQPLTGLAVMSMTSTSLWEPWLASASLLYLVAGAFWIPVVFMQIEMRDHARQAAAADGILPPRYFALYRRWFLFGIPGFGSVMAILWLMIAKPSV